VNASGIAPPSTARSLASLAAIFDDEGRVLLVHQTYGRRRWALPGGGLEPGESPQAAAVREVGEEVGVQFEPEVVVASYTLIETGGIRFVFRGGVVGEPSAHDEREIDDVGWFGAEELPKPLTRSAPYAVADALAGRTGAFRTIARRRAERAHASPGSRPR
jgi:8-oxo-dGTP pyrophosphatase MutT (NUDIX family)